MTDILLVQPPAYGIFMPPLGLASLAAYLRRDHKKVKVVDYNLRFYHHSRSRFGHAWRFNRNEGYWTDSAVYSRVIQPDFKRFSREIVRDILTSGTRLVGISVLDTGAFPTMDLIRTIREFFGDSVDIILGGPSMGTQFAERFLRDFGVLAAFQGEAEVGLNRFINRLHEGRSRDFSGIEGIIYLDSGRVVSEGKSKIPNLNDLPFPDFSDFSLREYALREPVLPISTSRGCVARCTFCSEAVFMGRYRELSPSRVADELQHQSEKYGVRVFRFNDSLINGNLKRLEAWLDEVIRRGVVVRFGGAQARINSRMSDEILQKLRQAGCELIQYGVETGSDRILKFMKKGVTSREAYDVVRRSARAGIVVQINIIVGHYRENLVDYLRTLLFVYRVRNYISYVNLNCYNFTEPTQDFDQATGIVGKETDRWRTRNCLNNYYSRQLRRRALALMLKTMRIKET